MVIAIDGEASSGKGTLAKHIAQKLGYKYLDTGVLYRKTAILALQEGVINNEEKCAFFATKILEQDFAEHDIRKVETSEAASIVAQYKLVRQELLQLQRDFITQYKNQGVVLDGRDIGTVVCPEAEIKVFVTADPKIRAKRRYEELKPHNTDLTLAEVEKEIITRDKRDKNRAISSLKIAKEAIIFDTSKYSKQEMFEKFYEIVSNSIHSQKI